MARAQNFLTSEDRQRIMAYLQARAHTVAGRRDLLIVDIMLNTGLRASELCRLRVADTPVVIGRDYIKIYGSKGLRGRPVPISRQLAGEIIGYIREIRPKTLPLHIRRKDFSKPLFYSQRKKPFERFGLWAKLVRLGKKVGLKINPQMLKKSFETTDDPDVGEQLDHVFEDSKK